MSRSLEAILTDLEDGLDREDTGPVLQAGEELRQRLQAMLAERELTVEDPLLAKRRRLHQRLEVVEAKARAGRFADADEDLDVVSDVAQQLARGLQAREPTDETASGPPRRLAAATLVARRELDALLASPTGALLALVSLLVFGLALASARPSPAGDLALVWHNAVEAVLVLAPLAGLVAGVGLLGEDTREGRLHLLASSGLSRAAIVAAKGIGSLAGLAIPLLGPALVVGLAGVLLGMPTSPLASLAFLAGMLLLAASFQAIALALDTLRPARGLALPGTVAAYVLFGPVWRTAFLAGEVGPEGGGLGAALVYRVSPVAAGRWVLESALGDPIGPIAPGLVVLGVWSLAGAGLACLQVQRGGFERSNTRQPN